MPTTPRAELLAKVGLFRSLSGADLDAVARLCTWKDHPAETDIVTYQDGSTDVHFLTSGRARVVIYSSQGRAVVFADIGTGETFGELSAIDSKPRSASVTTLEPSTVASMSAKAFAKAIETYPGVALALVRDLVTDMRRMDERVLEFSTLNVPGRIQAELLRYGVAAASPGVDSVVLIPGPSLAELAAKVSTHREAVSRELSRLAQIGILRREGSDLRLVSLAKLTDIVQAAKGD